MEKCNICNEEKHYCITEGCGIETGHINTDGVRTPVKHCDDCRYGKAVDEPEVPDGSDFPALAKWIVTGEAPPTKED